MLNVYGFSGTSQVWHETAADIMDAQTIGAAMVNEGLLVRVYDATQRNGNIYERLVQTLQPSLRLVA